MFYSHSSADSGLPSRMRTGADVSMTLTISCAWRSKRLSIAIFASSLSWWTARGCPAPISFHLAWRNSPGGKLSIVSPARFAHDVSQLLRVLDRTLTAGVQFSPIVPAEVPVAELNRSTDERLDRNAAALRSKGKIETSDYDVFLCYNSKDQRQVIAIAERLKERGILPWFDIWEVRPGIRWQKELQRKARSIKSAAVFIGPKGAGPWRELEVEVILQEFIRRNHPIIPVILEGRPGNPRLPTFLNSWHMIDMRKPEPDPFEQLVWELLANVCTE